MTLTSSPHIYFWRQATGKALSHALWEDKTAWSNFTRKLRLHIYHRWSHYYLSHSLMVRTAFSRFLVAVYQCWNQKNKTHHSAFTTSKILLTNLSIWLQKPLWPGEWLEGTWLYHIVIEITRWIWTRSAYQRSSTSLTFSKRGTILISCFNIEWPPKVLSRIFPGSASILNAHSMWTTARNISLSAKCIPGQIRRLCNLCNQRGCAMTIHYTYPAPNVQWSRFVGSFAFTDSEDGTLSPRYRSG